MSAPESTTIFNTQSDSDLTVGWREFISKSGSTQTSHWQNDGSQVVMTIDASWSNRFTIIQEVLGYCYRAGTSLFRKLPMRHPDYHWMYATNIEMNGVNWQNKFASTAGPVSGYDINRTRITFSVLPFNVLPNNDGNIVGGGFFTLPGGTVVTVNGGEYNRYVIKNRRPTTEFATTDRLQMQWVSGAPSTATIPTNVGFKLPLVTLTWKWMWVPDDYINDNYGNSLYIEGALGTVNNNWFAGYGPQTLYLDAVDYEPVNIPVDPQGILGYPAYSPPRVWNVTLHFKYRNPPIDSSKLSANELGYLVDGKRIAGHNLLPDLSKKIGSVSEVANYTSAMGTELGWFWYPATTKPQANGGAGSGGAYLFSQSNFENIFKAVP